MLEKCQQPNRIFIRSAIRTCGNAPTPAPFRAVMDREDNIRIASINSKQVGSNDLPGQNKLNFAAFGKQ